MLKKNYWGLKASLTFISLFSLRVNAQTTITRKRDNSNTSDNNWSVYLKGFIQADAMLDFQDMGFKDGFVAPSITIPETNSINSNFSIKQSQIGIGIKNEESKLSAYAEIDFLGPNGTTAPRFRQGYIKWNKLLIGQTWSNFSDISVFPNMFDFVGANGWLFTRRMQIRYTTPLSGKQSLSLSLEDPNIPDITLPEDSLQWKKKAIIPSLTSVYRYGNNKSYISLGGIITPISYDTRNFISESYSTRTIIGFGGMVSGKVAVGDLDNIRFQSSYGKGFSNNNIVLQGGKYDAIPNPQKNNRLETLENLNITGLYEHWWSPQWSSVAFYSYSQIGKKTFIPGNILRSFQNAGLNLVYQPYKRLRLGVEGNYGNIQNFDSQRAGAFRIQWSTSLSF